MNKKKIIIIVVLVLSFLLISVGLYFTFFNDKLIGVDKVVTDPIDDNVMIDDNAIKFYNPEDARLFLINNFDAVDISYVTNEDGDYVFTYTDSASNTYTYILYVSSGDLLLS